MNLVPCRVCDFEYVLGIPECPVCSEPRDDGPGGVREPTPDPEPSLDPALDPDKEPCVSCP